MIRIDDKRLFQFCRGSARALHESQAVKGDFRGAYEAGRLTAGEVKQRQGVLEGFCRAADTLDLAMTPTQWLMWLREAWEAVDNPKAAGWDVVAEKLVEIVRANHG